MGRNSSKDRKLALKLFGHHYSRLGSDWCNCFYCGDISSGFDHSPPLKLVAEYGYKRFKDAGIPLLLIPSCAECNSALGAKSLCTASERIEYLINFYSRKIETRKKWSAEDIDELGRGLKPQVLCRQARLSLWITKLRNLESQYVAYFE